MSVIVSLFALTLAAATPPDEACLRKHLTHDTVTQPDANAPRTLLAAGTRAAQSEVAELVRRGTECGYAVELRNVAAKDGDFTFEAVFEPQVSGG